MDLPSFLIGLVVAWIIALLFYWFSVQRQAENEAMTGANVISMGDHLSQMQATEARVAQLEADLEAARETCEGDKAAARAEIERLQQELDGLQTAATAPEPEPQMLQETETAQDLQSPQEPPPPPQPEDLKRVEGIGPKIEELLHNAGILTFAQLADADEERVRAILAEGGERYRMADPHSWSQQARLAAEGRWEELATLQDSLKGGRE